MKCREVMEVIHEALVLYIDDMSMIGSVESVSGAEGACDKELMVTLKDGETYRLFLIQSGK
jgi:hypothetical protein